MTAAASSGVLQGPQFLQIAADQKGLLGRGDHDTLHAIVGRQPPDSRMEFPYDLAIHEVVGGVRTVKHDPVHAIAIILDSNDRHCHPLG